MKSRHAIGALCAAASFACTSPDGPAHKVPDMRPMTVLDSARSRAPGPLIQSREAQLAGLPKTRPRDVSPEEESLIQALEKHLAGTPRGADIRNSLLDPRISHIDMRGDPVAQKLLNAIDAIREARANRLFAAEQRERASERSIKVTIAIPETFPLADTSIAAVVLRRPKEQPRDVVILRATQVSAGVLGSALRRLNAARMRDGDTVARAQILPIRDQNAPASWQATGQSVRANQDLTNLLRSTPAMIPGVGLARSMEIVLALKLPQ